MSLLIPSPPFTPYDLAGYHVEAAACPVSSCLPVMCDLPGFPGWRRAVIAHETGTRAVTTPRPTVRRNVQIFRHSASVMKLIAVELYSHTRGSQRSLKVMMQVVRISIRGPGRAARE